ncbi:hypothetical protein CF394_00530 [Tetzosporium hominis]|uniref:Type 4 fimbrial biogenesis protein PilX N-terminal domain-containing protein n=1 Tax=Tetzosporium hominis TaxID=2020506 RepID=A0A264W7M7_9BACL|nr:hypothetical protein [Tetzosporium hominis]OZS79531.1 hypothetical protein CF394_00530 [Tetzosporium hominis]
MVKQQKGYALLITLLLVILISVLGLAMITANITASKQNKIRETAVLAEDLALKGAEYFTLSLQDELESSINNTRLTVPQYISRLNDVLQKNKYKCSTGEVDISSESEGETSVCIERIYLEDNPSPTIEQLNTSLKWIVVIRSTSIVNEQIKTVRQHLMYGTDNVPDQLRYALSTNDNGNLFLHGGMDIYGDVKTEGNLIISSTAFWKKEGRVQWVPSLAPRIISRNFTPKIILPTNTNYNVYTMKNESYMPNDVFDNSHTTGKLFTSLTNQTDRLNANEYYTKLNVFNQSGLDLARDYLTDGEKVNFERRDLPVDNLNISNEISSQKNSAKYRDLASTTISRNSDSKFSSDKNNSFYFGSTQRYCKFWFLGCLEYGYRDVISNLTISSISTDQVNIKGIYYITGDLTITNSKLNSDAIFYVDGNVNMTNSSIVDGSNLYIFSNGEIEISNMSVDKDTPSKIKGFFYTKQNFLMYGVASNIYLNGGISADRIILTAVRGKSKDYEYDSVAIQKAIINNERVPSRMVIDYDPNLIPEFITFTRPADTEIAPTMNQPVIIEQEITSGP